MNYLRFRVAAGSIACAAVLTACDGGKATEPLPKPTQCIPQTLSILPEDTAVFVDGSYALNVQSVPTCQLTVALTYEAENGIVAFDSATRRVSGKAFGRGRLIVRAGQVADTIMVSVVPRARLAVTSLSSTTYGNPYVLLINTDLSGRRQVVEAGGNVYEGLSLDWAPNGASLVYHNYAPLWQSIWQVDTLGSAHALTPVRAEYFDSWPHHSADGQWVYYTHHAANLTTRPTLMRVPAAGGASEIVRPAPSAADEGRRPVPSPDGRLLAFQSWDPATGDPQIRFFDLQAGTELPQRFSGMGPRYSHSGAQLAFVRGTLVYVAGPDGSNPRQLSSAGSSHGGYVSWSADDQWLAVNTISPRLLELIHVPTGLAVSLPNSGNLLQAEWHPTARP